MPPQRTTRKGASSSSSRNTSAGTMDQFPLPPAAVPTKTGQTPSRTALQQEPSIISEAQKRALLDNLQLEVTERARKLRAQYALQAQGLRTRLEIRVHRIPTSLRQAKIRDLIQKHSQEEPNTLETKTPPKSKVPVRSPERKISPQKSKDVSKPQPATVAASQTQAHPRAAKRSSDDPLDNKENPSRPTKRTRTEAATTVHTDSTSNMPNNTRRASRRQAPGREVLSPKSNNSRTLPYSPFKPSGMPSLPPSPYKSNIARPTSPLKPAPAVAAVPTASSLAKAADKPKTKASTASVRGPSKQATTNGTATTMKTRTKRAAAGPVEPPSNHRRSDASDGTATSAGTTIVKRGRQPAPAAKSTTKKTGVLGRLAGSGSKTKKDAATKSSAPEKASAAKGSVKGRTLRKRA